MSPRAVALVLIPVAVIACAQREVAKAPPAPSTAMVPIASAGPLPSASAAPTSPPPRPLGPLPMHPVAKVERLIEVVSTGSGVELRVGHDPGGGVVGTFWYLPLVDGKPDLAQQTDELGMASTGPAAIELLGERPHLFFHKFAGFRSGPVDGYQVLGEDGHWSVPKLASAPGVGLKTFPWTKGRLLEWRGYAYPGETSLPAFRVVRGTPRTAPAVPAATAKRWEEAHFMTESALVLPSGEVLVTGSSASPDGPVTVLWSDDLDAPQVVPTPGEGDTELLGGSSLTDVRLRVGKDLFAWGGSGWVAAGAVPEKRPPDVWFGQPLLFKANDRWFYRGSRDAQWQTLATQAPDGKDADAACVVAPDGTVWKTEGELLMASKAPATESATITLAQLNAAREKSGLKAVKLPDW